METEKTAAFPETGKPVPRVTKDDLKRGLRKLGVRAGMKVLVHSSLSRFGYVEGGADTVIDALTELLTSEGTLLMPSFNHEAPYDEGEIFDVLRTPTTNGAVADAFWRRPGVLRSVNPTHAFAAWGKDAGRYTEDHQKTSAMGVDSPYYRLMKDGGWCLLLGVGYGSNTFHHVVESCEGAPCLRLRGERYPVRLADGREIMAHTWSWRDGSCPIDDGAAYAPFMAAIDRRERIGGADATLYRLEDGYAIIAKFLREGLGELPPCSRCPRRPRVCRWTVEDETDGQTDGAEDTVKMKKRKNVPSADAVRPVTTATVAWENGEPEGTEGFRRAVTRVFAREIQIRYFDGNGFAGGKILPLPDREGKALFGLLERFARETDRDESPEAAPGEARRMIKVCSSGRCLRKIECAEELPPTAREIAAALAGITGADPLSGFAGTEPPD